MTFLPYQIGRSFSLIAYYFGQTCRNSKSHIVLVRMQCSTYKPYGREFVNTEQSSIGIYPLTAIPLLRIHSKAIQARQGGGWGRGVQQGRNMQVTTVLFIVTNTRNSQNICNRGCVA